MRNPTQIRQYPHLVPERWWLPASVTGAHGAPTSWINIQQAGEWVGKVGDSLSGVSCQRDVTRIVFLGDVFSRVFVWLSIHQPTILSVCLSINHSIYLFFVVADILSGCKMFQIKSFKGTTTNNQFGLRNFSWKQCGAHFVVLHNKICLSVWIVLAVLNFYRPRKKKKMYSTI